MKSKQNLKFVFGENARKVLHRLMERPITSSGWLVDNAGIFPATINKTIAHLERAASSLSIKGV